MGNKRVTLVDVARKAGLSTTSASMILTGRPDTRLSAEAHAKVHAAAAELGYRPNVAARALRTDKSRSIAVISDHVATTRFAGGLIRGVIAAAETLRHVVLVLETGGEPAREIRAIGAALDRQVDGIIFASMRAREIFVPDIHISVPVVMLNSTNTNFPCSVLPDEFEGGRTAVRQLAEHGVTDRLILLGHNPDEEKNVFRSHAISQRLAGIAAEMAERGLAFEARLGSWEWEVPNGYDLVHRQLKKRRPRAFLCLNDRLAFGAYQAIGEAGLSIPDDIGLISFDNDELASCLRPGLTTIALPHQEMGKKAVEILLGEPSAGEILIPMPVISRSSLAPKAGS